MLVLENISKSYSSNASGSVNVLKNCNMAVARGESVAIIGSSGSGKSTLLNIMAGLDDPDNGEVFISSTKVPKSTSSYASRFRRKKIGFIFQNHRLLPELSCVENIVVAARRSISFARRTQEAKLLLTKVGLESKFGNLPGELSGGQQQRVAFCRALANKPQIVLADEPTGSLNQEAKNDILELLFRCNREENVTVVIVTHDMNILGRFNRVLKISNNNLVEI